MLVLTFCSASRVHRAILTPGFPSWFCLQEQPLFHTAGNEKLEGKHGLRQSHSTLIQHDMSSFFHSIAILFEVTAWLHATTMCIKPDLLKDEFD